LTQRSREEEGNRQVCPVWIDQITAGLGRLGFQFVVEPTRENRPKPVTCVRLRGGLREGVRFFLTVDPAITRKRTIPEGTALKSNAHLRVASIEPLGMDVPMYDITTGKGAFIANGVVSHNRGLISIDPAGCWFLSAPSQVQVSPKALRLLPLNPPNSTTWPSATS
jgi:hypothetical protein